MHIHNSANRGCIQTSQGATGDSFHRVKGFIEISRPYPIMLAHVVELSEVLEDSGISDEEFIREVLESLGLAVCCYRVSGSDHGSCVERERLYFVVF